MHKLCISSEPAWEDLKGNYIHLTDVAYSLGVPVEGNIYNYHHSQKTYKPTPAFLAKRHTYASFVSSSKNIIEIGFNAGHSALLALTVNPDLHYTGIDIAYHPYTEPCFKFLKEKFGNRIDLIIGDSKHVLPQLFSLRPHLRDKIDGWIVDGDHVLEGAIMDMENVLTLSKNGDRLLFDDTDVAHLDWLLKYYQVTGKIIPVDNALNVSGSLVFSINKS